MKMKTVKIGVGLFLCAVGLSLLGIPGATAEQIVVSWESNGVLVATGMAPWAAGTVEWASSLGKTFTNAPVQFDFMADSNGTMRLEVPRFFRVLAYSPSEIPMVPIPGGTNSGTDPDFGAYSLTVSTFYMDRTEVTKAQWDEVYTWAVANGYSFDNAGSGKGSSHPVHTVNWYDCVKWCNARSQKEDKTPCYTVGGNVYKTGQSAPDCNFSAGGYRLPTDAEWEYAARGGYSSRRFPWGDTIQHTRANYNSSTSYSYDTSSTRGYHPTYATGSTPYTAPVGSFSSNGYGLYDMSGNAWEWCNDWHPGYEGSARVLRGGSWFDDAGDCRTGLCSWIEPGARDFDFGFRSVRSAD